MKKILVPIDGSEYVDKAVLKPAELAKSLAVALNIDRGDKMMWKIDRGELVLRKAG
mgnify:CR=1 FL=1